MRAACLIVCALLTTGCAPPLSPPFSDAAAAGVPVPSGAQEATVVRLTDGDTLQLHGRGP